MPESDAAPLTELTFSVRQLSRQPGTSRRRAISFEAPEGLGAGVIGVPEGGLVSLDLLEESVLEGVLVTGTVRAQALGECGRCLDEVAVPVEATFQELFEYPERAQGAAGPATTEDDGNPSVVDDMIDLTGPVRDAIVLSLPFQVLCRDDCEGLCPECGVRLADEPGHGHSAVDPRWAGLAGLLEDDFAEGAEDAEDAEDQLEDDRKEI
ncbi:MAG: YceD family protein [Bifidobacteriaceae bacterium]|jgi:uncharacterized protein|nr:YceD family protein [Bifidobacteriaceae bacterium]